MGSSRMYRLSDWNVWNVPTIEQVIVAEEVEVAMRTECRSRKTPRVPLAAEAVRGACLMPSRSTFVVTSERECPLTIRLGSEDRSLPEGSPTCCCRVATEGSFDGTDVSCDQKTPSRDPEGIWFEVKGMTKREMISWFWVDRSPVAE